MNYQKKIGIVSYGAYIPKYRITVDEIANNWGTDANSFKKGLGLIEKSVPGLDEDTVTLAVNSSLQAKKRLNRETKISAVYVGSESHPYAVKPTSSIVGEVLHLGENWTASDLEFACKAGSAGIQIVASHVASGWIDEGLAVGSDTAQGAPGDALEYSAAAGSAAFILGKENIIAELKYTTSVTTDTPDFWRRENQKYPRHGSRFTGEPAYFKHIVNSTKRLLKETNMNISEFDHVVFHMPNGKFPLSVAKHLGVLNDQLKEGFIVERIGNTYSACSLLGLALVLDKAKVNEKLLVVSYGSGAGSDAFYFEIKPEIENFRKFIQKNLIYDKSIEEQLESKIYLNYGQYVRHTKKILIH